MNSKEMNVNSSNNENKDENKEIANPWGVTPKDLDLEEYHIPESALSQPALDDSEPNGTESVPDDSDFNGVESEPEAYWTKGGEIVYDGEHFSDSELAEKYGDDKAIEIIRTIEQ